MIFETHAHYDDEVFNEDREQLLAGLPEKGIGRVINVGASIETTRTTLALAEAYDYIYAAVGVHPSDIDGLNEETYSWLKAQTAHPKTVAVGEIGLDYYWDNEPREVQKKWFIRQLELARELDLPVLIHSREAAADTMEIMKEHAKGLSGVIHCYSYSKEMAQEYIKMGFYIGVGGVVTFKNAKKLKEVVENILTDNSKVPKHGSGVGVINVHSRIQLMFGEQYGLEIYSEPDEGTRVVIHIPAIPYTKENAEQLEMQKYTQGRDVDEKE